MILHRRIPTVENFNASHFSDRFSEPEPTHAAGQIADIIQDNEQGQCIILMDNHPPPTWCFRPMKWDPHSPNVTPK